jgi:hypothetical protein
MEFKTEDQAAGRLDTLLTCLTTALTATTRGCPQRTLISYGGAATWDSTDMAWVRPVRIYPSTENAGVQDTTPTSRKRPLRWYIEAELGVIRCVTGMESGYQPRLPSAGAITLDAAVVMEDARALRAVASFLIPDGWKRQIVIHPWQPLPSEGGATGGTINISVPFRDVDPDDR